MCFFWEERNKRREDLRRRLLSTPSSMAVATRTRTHTMAVVPLGTGGNPETIRTCQLPLKRLKLAFRQVLFGLNSVSPKFELVGHLLKSGRFCNCLGRRRDILETGKVGTWWQPEEERREFTEWPQLGRPP